MHLMFIDIYIFFCIVATREGYVVEFCAFIYRDKDSKRSRNVVCPFSVKGPQQLKQCRSFAVFHHIGRVFRAQGELPNHFFSHLVYGFQWINQVSLVASLLTINCVVSFMKTLYSLVRLLGFDLSSSFL